MKEIIQKIKQFFIEAALSLFNINLTTDMKTQSFGRYGIQETVEILKAVQGIQTAVRLSVADDGKITIPNDLINFITPLTQIPVAVQGADKVPKELLDLQPQEIDQLEALFGASVSDPKIQRAFAAFVEFGDAIIEIVKKEEDNGKVFS